VPQPPIPPPNPSLNQAGGPPRPPPVPKFVVPIVNESNDGNEQQSNAYNESQHAHNDGAEEFQEIYKENDNDNDAEDREQPEDNAPISPQRTMPLPAFLAQLKNNDGQAGLRPVPIANRSAPKDTRSALLTQLQNKKTKENLRQVKVEDVKKEKNNGKDESALVAELLKRRGFIDDDDENDDDSDGSGWSDDDK